jgi:hypothetical protein
VVLEGNASEAELVVPASLLACCTREMPPTPTLVKMKFAAVDTPGAVAVTVNVPELELAVTAAEVATPLESVTAVFIPPANVTLGQVAGAAKVTVAPVMGLPKPSFSVATRAEA